MLDPYELVREPAPPDLPGSVVVRETGDEAIDALAADLFMQAVACVRSFGDFHLALSAGPWQERLCVRLMIDPNFRSLPWKRTHLWLVDEGRHSHESEGSRFRRVHELVGDHADIPRGQVHPIPGARPAAHDDYERELREHLGWREKGHDRLDFVVLGVGEDGSVGGLRAGSPVLGSSDRLVDLTGDSGARDGVTMTFGLLNASRFLALLAPGAGMQRVIESATSGGASASDLPVLGLAPLAGVLRWYLDHPACPGWDEAP